MRRIGLIVLLLVWCLFAWSPAEAAPFESPFELFFDITRDLPQFGDINPGTISYAGGTAPLVGSNIAVSAIVRTPAVGFPEDLRCLNCTLSFSTGPFAGTIPASEPGGLANYLFSDGGSLQIIGGALGETFSLPEGTTLLTGVRTDASTFQDDSFDLNTNNSVLSFEGALNPDLLSHFGFPAGASLAGTSVIATTEMSNAPNPFVLSTFTSQGPELEPSFVHVNAVPLPDTLWPFAVGFLAFAVWRGRRKAFPL